MFKYIGKKNSVSPIYNPGKKLFKKIKLLNAFQF